MAKELRGLAAGLVAGLAVVAASYGLSALATHGQTKMREPKMGETNAASTPVSAGTDPASSQLVASGSALYTVACIGCHGAQAQGTIGPSLHHLGDPDTKVARNIKNGFPGRMPSYKDKYSDAQINSLVAYVQTFE